MKALFQGTWILSTMIAIAMVTGCGPANHDDDHDHADDNHEHAEEHEGPHGGHVIELGRDHQFHAELVEDEGNQTVTVYILGEDMKELPIDAATMAMNLVVDGEAKSFELAAVGPVEGKSSQYAGGQTELFEALHEHEASGKLNVTIDGAPYSGVVEHHDHDEDHGDGHDDH